MSSAGALWEGDVRDDGLIGSPDTIRERIAHYQDAGVQELIIGFMTADIPSSIGRYAKELTG